MPRPGRQTTERAKDFKGTLLQLVKAMSTYKISLIAVSYTHLRAHET